jgi:hypothetical protein
MKTKWIGLLLLATFLCRASAGEIADQILALRQETSADESALIEAYVQFRNLYPELAEQIALTDRRTDVRPHWLLFSKEDAPGAEVAILNSLADRLKKLDPSLPDLRSTPLPEGTARRVELMQLRATWIRTAQALADANPTFSLDRLAILRGQRPADDPLLAEIRQNGVEERLRRHAAPFDQTATALRSAIEANQPTKADGVLLQEARADASLALRYILRGHGAERIVYATRTHHSGIHFYESIGYNGNSAEYTHSKSGGRLVLWNVADNTETVLLDDASAGAVRDPCLSADGQTILFSWRKSGENYYHLYTLPVTGGTPVQLTDGPWNDFEAIWVPDGGIVFCSTRCHRWVPCFEAEVANLHRCDADGRNIRTISSNVETECAPWMLPDGRIVYMRWEYTEKDRAVFHNLWTVNPDGTNHQIYFGNVKGLEYVWNDPKPVPGTEAVVFVAHNHGGAEHTGSIAIVNPLGGPNDHTRIHYVTAPDRSVKTAWRDPFPIAQDLFLAARGQALVLLDSTGREAELFRLPDAAADQQQILVHEPRIVAPHPPVHRIPPRSDLTKDSGEFIIADIYEGRYMDGVKRGEIRDLLIIEELPKPIHHNGHTEPLCYNGTFMLERVLGTVPVEPDGSAYFKAPPLRSLMFIARDQNGLSVKRMQSFATTMPGERQSCLGCHDNRTRIGEINRPLQALSRPPSEIQPFANTPEVFDYPRDIQPILNRNCLPCHNREQRAGGVVLDDDMDIWFTQSYVTLQVHEQVGTGFRALMAGMGPREVGSSASGLLKKMREGHQGCSPTEQEKQLVALWADSAGVWAGTYAAVNTTQPAQPAWDRELVQILSDRCASCHKIVGGWRNPIALIRTPEPASGPDLGEKYGLRMNLTDPARSLLLRAPLSQEQGGLGLCKDKEGQPVAIWSGPDDPGYQTVLRLIEAWRDKLVPLRYDRPGFRPLPAYVREMKRQNLLPADFDMQTSPWDPYDLDRRYWESFWHIPQKAAPSENAGH